MNKDITRMLLSGELDKKLKKALKLLIGEGFKDVELAEDFHWSGKSCGIVVKSTQKKIKFEIYSDLVRKLFRVSDYKLKAFSKLQEVFELLEGDFETRLESNCKVIIQLDRKKAIQKAVKISKPKSIIAILGKGHENYYLVKGKKFYLNDFEQISKY